MVSARELVGRRIVAFDPGVYKAGTEVPTDEPFESKEVGPFTTLHHPRITLDDGSILHFHAEEDPRGGSYGIFIQRVKSR